MAPLVLAGTVITHLFGGSAGREGTAVQMGGSIASTVGRWFNLSQADTRTLLMAGVAAGFGAVFGTPLTGAIFAVEVLAIGLVSFQSIVPCLIGSIVGDVVTSAWGIHHTHFPIRSLAHMALVHEGPALNLLLLGKVIVAAAVFGLASVLFAELAHSLHRIYKWAVPWPVFRPALGGVLVIALAWLVAPSTSTWNTGISALTSLSRSRMLLWRNWTWMSRTTGRNDAGTERSRCTRFERMLNEDEAETIKMRKQMYINRYIVRSNSRLLPRTFKKVVLEMSRSQRTVVPRVSV
jgi:H+/Cl- antiporter ClcA